MIDEYRVTLLKKKIRAAIPTVGDIRFNRSRDREHLIIDIYFRYYGRSSEVGEEIINRLARNRIEYNVVIDRFFRSRDPKRIDFISIPIDQEALPERKRPH